MYERAICEKGTRFQEPSPQLTKMNDMDILMEDSLDGGPPSVGSGDIPAIIPPPGTSTPNTNNTPTTPATAKKVPFITHNSKKKLETYLHVVAGKKDSMSVKQEFYKNI